MTEGKIRAEHEREDAALVEKALLGLLETVEGRRFLWMVVGLGRLFVNAFDTDAARMAFRLGEQNVAQQILLRIAELSPEGWYTVQKEMNDVRKRRERQLAGSGAGE